MAVPAGDVGDPGGRIRLESSVDSRSRGEPTAGQELLVQRPCPACLAFVCIGAVGGVGDAARPFEMPPALPRVLACN